MIKHHQAQNCLQRRLAGRQAAVIDRRVAQLVRVARAGRCIGEAEDLRRSSIASEQRTVAGWTKGLGHFLMSESNASISKNLYNRPQAGKGENATVPPAVFEC